MVERGDVFQFGGFIFKWEGGVTAWGESVLMGVGFRKKTIGWRGVLPMHPHTMGNPVHGCSNRLKHRYLHMANLSLFLMSIYSGYHSFST